MATIKSYTDIEQSKKLAVILPIESADMWYSYYGNPKYNPTIAYKGQQWFLCQIRNSLHDDIPCYSLATLLAVLPSGKALIHDKESGEYKCICYNYDTAFYSNPIDACYELILKLHELNLL